MSRPFLRAILVALVLVGLASASVADDWTALRLRGEVFVYQEGWVALERGDIVSDDSIIRTLGRGRVSFVRGAETIDLLPNSQIRIIDQTGRKFTTVMSDYGDVAIEAEVQNVEHFSVATPFLAAVVKGTRFSVSSNDTSSEVSVERGQVFVEDTASHDTVTITAGQTASTSSLSSGETLIVTETAAVVPDVTRPAPLPSTTKSTNTTANTPSEPSAAAPSSLASSNDNGNNGNHNGQDNGNNGNHNGQDNGNQNDNQGPGNNNGNDNSQGNDNKGPGNNNGKGKGRDED